MNYQNLVSVLSASAFGFGIACVASVSVGFGSKERDFWCFACAENGEKAKTEIWGWGRGWKEPLADKPLDFENLRSPANGARDWLG